MQLLRLVPCTVKSLGEQTRQAVRVVVRLSRAAPTGWWWNDRFLSTQGRSLWHSYIWITSRLACLRSSCLPDARSIPTIERKNRQILTRTYRGDWTL